MLDGHSSVVWQSHIYIWGGKEEPNQQLNGPTDNAPVYYSNTVLSINTAQCVTSNNSSVVLQPVTVANTPGSTNAAGQPLVPKGRAFHSAALYGKHMFITGGLTDEGDGEAENNHLPAFDLERRLWQSKSTYGDVPCPRCHHTSIVYGDTLFLHGGYPLQSDRRKDLTPDDMAAMQHAMYDVHELNIATLRWRRIQVAHTPTLWGHSSIIYNKNVILFGGVDVVENVESGAVSVWHTEKKQWRWADFQDLDLRCAMHTAVEEGGRMFVFSGVSFRTNTKLRSLYEFNLELGRWRELHPNGSPPLGRIGHSAVAFNNCVFIIGGAVEDLQAGGVSGGRAEKVVHVYNITLNEWSACALVHPTMSSAEQEANKQSAMTREREKAWAGGTIDPSVGQEAQQEFQQNANQVRDSIARAKAIQSLADSAIQQIEPHQQNQPRPIDQIVPFGDDSRQHQQQQQQQRQHQVPMEQSDGAGGFRTSQARPASPQPADASRSASNNPAKAQVDQIAQLRTGLTGEDSRRVIEHLQRENEELRLRLEQFRESQSDRNPYEVPMFNVHSTTSGGLGGKTLAPNELVDPRGGAHGSSRMTSDVLADIPRLNLNVADPPRAVGGAPSGFMSRPSISNLVARVTGGAGANPASALAASTNPSTSLNLDPTSFLMAPRGGGGPLAEAATLQGHQPQSYDQLFGAQGRSSSMNAYGGGGADMAASVPLSLQPLLSLLGGQSFGPSYSAAYGQQHTPMMAASAGPSPAEMAAAAQAQPTPQQQQHHHVSPQFSAHDQPSATRAPLSKVVSGQASMLGGAYPMRSTRR